MTTDTPRADDFPRIGCVQHDCDACATRAQEFVQLAADLTAARAELEYTKGLEFNRRLALVAQNWRTRTNKAEADLAACRAALRELMACKEPINDGGKRVHLAWATARALVGQEEEAK